MALGDLGTWFSDAVDWLKDFSGSPWFYVVILGVAILDSILPIVPSETMVIIGGVSAGVGDLQLALVILVAGLGAFVGDNLAYLIGRRTSPWLLRRAETRPKSARRLDWAGDQIKTRGGPLLITARFIPGGRSALTLTSGVTRQPRPWFMGWILVASVIWAVYAALLGYIGGATFEDNHTAAFVLAFAMALSVTVTIEIVRHVRNRRLEKRLRAAHPTPDVEPVEP